MMERRDLPPPGWYDDPAQSGQLRYWDGDQWTADTLAGEDGARSTVGRDPNGWDWKWLFFSFEGRAHRAHFWGGGFAVSGISILLAIVLVVVDGTDLAAIGLLAFVVLNVWAALAIQVKRWHDRDKSGWWVLIGAGMLPGTPGPNQYGPDPRV